VSRGSGESYLGGGTWQSIASFQKPMRPLDSGQFTKAFAHTRQDQVPQWALGEIGVLVSVPWRPASRRWQAGAEGQKRGGNSAGGPGVSQRGKQRRGRLTGKLGTGLPRDRAGSHQDGPRAILLCSILEADVAKATMGIDTANENVLGK
jgi:hypothetical protein